MKVIPGIAFILLLLSSCAPSATYYIVRHAEKAAPATGADTRDPELSETGKQRAETLAAIIPARNIKQVFVTSTIRSRSTAAPVAAIAHVTPSVYPGNPDSTFIAGLRLLHGATLVVGHSNTVDDLVNKLTGKTFVRGDLPETVFDRLYIITRKKNRFGFTENRFGPPTP